MKGYIGIDPGKFGAAAMLFEDGRYVLHDWQCEKMAAKTLYRWNNEFNVCASLEKIIAVRSRTYYPNMKLANNFGFWRGLLVAYGIEFDVVPPQTWQKKVLIPGTGKTTKDRAFETAKELFPGARKHLTKISKHNGRADALLIAYNLKNERDFESKFKNRIRWSKI